MNYTVFDAAIPPHTPPVFAQGVMGYIGGPRAARVWTAAEWQPFHRLKQFPIYVPDILASPLPQAREAVRLALALGWSGKMTGDEQRAIIIDLETGADRLWYSLCAAEISDGGFTAVAYGSLNTVLDNAAADVLAADWVNNPIIPAGQTLHGNQYRANISFMGTTIDESLIDGWLYKRGGVGPRRKAA